MRGSPSRRVGGEQSDDQEQERNASQRSRIDAVQTIQQTARQIRGPCRKQSSGNQADEDGPSAFAENETEDIALLSANCHADADLPGTQDDDVTDRAVDPHQREQKSQQTDRRGNQGREAGDDERRRLALDLLRSEEHTSELQ